MLVLVEEILENLVNLVEVLARDQLVVMVVPVVQELVVEVVLDVHLMMELLVMVVLVLLLFDIELVILNMLHQKQLVGKYLHMVVR